MKDKTFLNKREWLNSKTDCDTGAVHTTVSADEYSLNADMTLWDCSKKITLNFSIWDKSGIKQRKAKIAKLINHLKQLETAIDKGSVHFLKLKEEAKAKRKQKRKQRDYI